MAAEEDRRFEVDKAPQRLQAGFAVGVGVQRPAGLLVVVGDLEVPKDWRRIRFQIRRPCETAAVICTCLTTGLSMLQSRGTKRRLPSAVAEIRGSPPAARGRPPSPSGGTLAAPRCRDARG